MHNKFSKISNKEVKPEVDEILNKDDNTVKVELSEETVAVTKPVEAYVTGCEKLYLRSKPDKESESISILDKDAKVVILDFNASEDYYKVCAENGFEGFCMKKFIAINMQES